jgi:hypothetical protein
MSNNLADFVLHIDESLPRDRLNTLENHIHAIDGVVCACNRNDQPHLVTIVYNPEHVEAHDILVNVQNAGFHGELVGL